MNKEHFKINPVKAAVKLHQKENCGIHALNDACYGTCAAFKGVDNPWTVSDECANECGAFINQMRKDFYGLGGCDHQAPLRPVIWDQSPNLFPMYLKKYGNVAGALGMAYKACENTPYPESCKKKALLQSYAVVDEQKPKKIRENYEDKDNDDDNGIDFQELEDSNPVAFWVGFAMALIMFSVLVYLIIKYIRK